MINVRFEIGDQHSFYDQAIDFDHVSFSIHDGAGKACKLCSIFILMDELLEYSGVIY